MLRFKINHSLRPKEKNNTLGYPIMKKEKKRKKKEKRKKRRTKEKPKELGSKDP